MHCPFCNTADTKVIDSRLVAAGGQIRRRRECITCGERYTTYELPELVMPYVVKTDGTREPFNEEKLRGGLMRALEKRPVDSEQIESAVTHIKNELRSTGEREVPSRQIGEALMETLHGLDQVAYVRFASVYRQFEDIEEFRAELDKLDKLENG